VACAELSAPLPLKGPVGAILQFRWFKKSAPADGTPKQTVPDCDNANKLPMDCIAHMGLIPDDKHVTRLHIEKYWTSDPDQVGLLIMLQPATQKMLKI
jgi:Holliday junction resolvase RusA-like endonuclease